MLSLAIAAGLLLLATPSSPAPAAQRAPAAGSCQAPPGPVRQELERFLEVAAGHATRSEVCTDGSGVRTTAKLVEACVAPAHRGPGDAQPVHVLVRYRVSVAREQGGECSPQPDCARPPPPQESAEELVVHFVRTEDGLRLVVPAELPGIPVLTPLDRIHSTECYGDSPAFVPAFVR